MTVWPSEMADFAGQTVERTKGNRGGVAGVVDDRYRTCQSIQGAQIDCHGFRRTDGRHRAGQVFERTDGNRGRFALVVDDGHRAF